MVTAMNAKMLVDRVTNVIPMLTKSVIYTSASLADAHFFTGKRNFVHHSLHAGNELIVLFCEATTLIFSCAVDLSTKLSKLVGCRKNNIGPCTPSDTLQVVAQLVDVRNHRDFWFIWIHINCWPCRASFCQLGLL